jgi:ubiquitin C-terminal hydrolase
MLLTSLPAGNYARLLDEMWSGNDSIINPLQFKVSVAKFAPQFSGHNQHDAQVCVVCVAWPPPPLYVGCARWTRGVAVCVQELLAFLLDGLHEDLNLVTKKTYREATATSPAGRPDTTLAAQAWALHLERNQSIVVDLMQGQLKSTVSCRRPGCTKVTPRCCRELQPQPRC